MVDCLGSLDKDPLIPQAIRLRIHLSYLIFLLIGKSISWGNGNDFHLSTLPRIKENLSVKVKIFCIFWSRYQGLYSIHVVKAFFIRVRISKGEISRFSRRIVEVVGERHQELLWILSVTISATLLIIIFFGLFFLRLLWRRYGNELIVDLSCDSLPPPLVIRHHPVHRAQSLWVQLPLHN